ncbi:MAG: methionine synthase [Promethearchaeota archaeon]
MKLENKKILAACLEDCVHVAGIYKFCQVTQQLGYEYDFIGPAVTIPLLIQKIAQSNAKICAISYRLTPENGISYVKQLITTIKQNNLENRTYLIGGLPKFIEKVKELQFFSGYFIGGESVTEIISTLQHESITESRKNVFAKNLIERIQQKAPFPIIRAHFGLPSLDSTFEGISALANAQVLDVISIAPDQPAQKWLQHPEYLKTLPSGIGGAPIRNRTHLEKIFQSAQSGNYPLLRIYSGTQDLIPNAKLFQNTINNAWAAIPIFWYSQLDGRGPNRLDHAIKEHLDTIRWHADQNIPVEVNDPHQWGLRMAPDHLVVVDAWLSANIAKKLGVRTYIEQFMFNTPAGNTWQMDLARVLAMIEIVEPLIDSEFRVIRESRAGLTYFSPKPNLAKGQLCASTMIQMSILPDIMHVVSYSEGDHAAEPIDIIESCELIQKIIEDSLQGLPDFLSDPKVIKQKDHLLSEAKICIEAIQAQADLLGEEQPLLNPNFLCSLVKKGVLNAPMLQGNVWTPQQMTTNIIDGKCEVVDSIGKVIPEKERLESLNFLNKSDTPLFFKIQSTNGV